MGTPAESACFAPEHMILRAQCDAGHSVAGLFVLCRPAPPGSGKFAALVRTLREATTGSGGGARFWLGLVGQGGYVEVIADENLSSSSDPWPAFYSFQNPHTVKLVADAPYECHFVRHPDPALAFRALEELNGVRPRQLTKDWQPQQRKFAIETQHASGGTQYHELVLKVPEDPAAYVPRGAERYGEWVLYADMPHAQCPELRDATQRLQLDLGSLRYVVGGEGEPYQPEKEVKDRKGKTLNRATINVGVFDVRTLNAVYQFQKDALAGRAFQVSDRSAAHGASGRPASMESSCAYLRGSMSTGADLGPAPDGGKARADGVVDASTAAAIAAWRESGHRKPGSILVCLPARKGKTDWYTWLRQEAAESLYAWSALAEALGCAEGVAANHTFRSALTDIAAAGFGRSAVSVHKTGLAIDVGLDSNYYDCAKDWPVTYVCDRKTPGKNKKGRKGFRIDWLLFATSTLDCETEEQASAAIGERLNTALSDSHELAGVLQRAAQTLLGELKGGWNAFRTRYFRDEVQPWVYDPWHPEGGAPASAPVRAADVYAQSLERRRVAQRKAEKQQKLAEVEDKVSRKAKKTARDPDEELARRLRKEIAELERELAQAPLRRAFVNLTALAAKVGLSPIGSWTNLDEPVGQDWGLAAVEMSTNKPASLAARIEALQGEHGNLVIEIGGAEVALSDVDAAFMKQWIDAASKAESLRIGLRAGATITKSKAGQKAAERLAGLLEQFADREMCEKKTGLVRNGSAWAEQVREKAASIRNDSPVAQKDGKKASTKKNALEWTLLLDPVVARAGADSAPVVIEPNATVYVPGKGEPIGMEWWHFQRSDLISGKSYGPCLGEIGWAAEILGPPGSCGTVYSRRTVGYPADHLATTRF